MSLDTHYAARQREVLLIRHGEKNSSTAAVDPNLLTEKGRRDALVYGARLRATPTLEVYCSTDAEGRPVDRSHDTGWYIHAGYAGLEYDAANALFRSDSAEKQQFVPGLEERLRQRVPDRILKEYKSGSITRPEAMEQCYQMLGADAEKVDLDERAFMLQGTQSYLAAILYHLIERAPKPDEKTRTLDLLGAAFNLTLREDPVSQPYSPHAIVLIGHDPNIGGLQKYLEPTAPVSELIPLVGIKVTRIPPLWMTYSFGAGADYVGKLHAENSLECFASSQRREESRRLL